MLRRISIGLTSINVVLTSAVPTCLPAERDRERFEVNQGDGEEKMSESQSLISDLEKVLRIEPCHLEVLAQFAVIPFESPA